MSLPLLPHASLPEDAPTWGSWAVQLNDSEPKPVEESLDDWDYASDLHFGVESSVDPAAIRACLDGYPPAVVHLVGTVDCRATFRRFVAATPLNEDGAATLSIHVPRGSAAGQVVLTQHLVLGRDLPGGRWWMAQRKGARLAADGPVRVDLEGGPERFPTESLSFKAAGLDDIPWKLQLDATDPYSSFRGSVRLLVNTDHPAGRALLDPKNPLFDALTSVVKATTLHQLLGSVTTDGLAGTEDADPDSVAAALSGLANVWLGLDLAEASQLLHDDPVTFWDRVSARTDLLKALP